MGNSEDDERARLALKNAVLVADDDELRSELIETRAAIEERPEVGFSPESGDSFDGPARRGLRGRATAGSPPRRSSYAPEGRC
ncbi:hypothetical protein [Nocardia bovistercoris]|uniref:Uncharacterized protein n=1 Tax=Nocardia bovistercoris TaxID=2785916 RepID=A0A931IFA5_9NOCA|nr:hypothetical protein [Nocardia bovistercoris]MBH0779310.1 hypothetical protein [Nocardia bovistercoris]